MKMTPEEDSVYMKAFGASKAKSVKERMAEAQAALEAHRKGGEMRAVEKGIKDGRLSAMASARRNRIDAASGFGNKKK